MDLGKYFPCAIPCVLLSLSQVSLCPGLPPLHSTHDPFLPQIRSPHLLPSTMWPLFCSVSSQINFLGIPNEFLFIWLCLRDRQVSHLSSYSNIILKFQPHASSPDHFLSDLVIFSFQPCTNHPNLITQYFPSNHLTNPPNQ